MKGFLIIITLGFLLLSTCEKETVPNAFHFNEEFEFQLDEEYQSFDNRMKLTIEDVQDSRCPLQAMCVWQGEARVKIMVDILTKYELELSTFDNHADTIQNYEIRLVNVIPYPEISNQIQRSDYRVVMEIRILN